MLIIPELPPTIPVSLNVAIIISCRKKYTIYNKVHYCFCDFSINIYEVNIQNLKFENDCL